MYDIIIRKHSFLMIAYGDYQLVDYDFLMSKTQQLTYMYYIVVWNICF